MNRILLTGASGFLGTILRTGLEGSGNQIIAIDRTGGGLQIDIAKLFHLHSDTEIDVVIHAAGKAHSVPKNQTEEQVFYDVNYKGTINLCNALDALKVKPKAFVFISTIAVYGIDEGELIAETHPLNGQTPYAKSKIQAEQYLIDWSGKNNVQLSILRLPLLAGPNPPGNLGAMIHGIQTGKYLSIGKASAKKSILWAEDLLTILPVLIEKGGTYNLSDGYHPSFGELEQTLSTALNKSKPIKIPLFLAKAIALFGDLLGAKAPLNSPKLNKITSTLTFSDQKARKELNWKPQNVLSKLQKIII